MKFLKCDIDPSLKIASLYISGLFLNDRSGKILNIGKCSVKEYGETRSCESMDQSFMGLKDAMNPNWNGGVYGVVLKEGKINVGDDVLFN